MGPWGGSGGTARDFNFGPEVGITKIVVKHGDVVDSITYTVNSRSNGDFYASAKIGGTGGSPTEVCVFLGLLLTICVIISSPICIESTGYDL